MNDIFHILINPPAGIETAVVKEAAAVLKRDPYETRMLLSGNTPKLIAHYSTNTEATLVSNQLKPLGLNAYVVNDEELHKPESNVFLARSVFFAEKEVHFRDKAGSLLKLDAADVFLILKARFIKEKEKGSPQAKRKFNPTATLLLGGIPVWSKTKESPKEIPWEAKLFVRIYNRISPVPLVEFYEENFDFSSLGTKMTLASFTNVNAMVTELSTRFTAAIFDDTLVKSAALAVDGQKSVIDLNCKLICLYYQALANSINPG